MNDFVAALIAPLLFPLDPSRRIFIGFIVVALCMALWFFYRQQGHANLRAFFSWFFQKKIWLHRSSLLDFKLLFANSVISKLLIAPLLVAKLAVIVWVSGGLRDLFGGSPQFEIPYWLIVLLFTLVLFVVEDFTRFIVHVAYHRIPWLWEFHKVHHSAEVLTPVTLYRSHPVESLISRSASLFILGGVTGVFVFLFPGQLSAIEIVGVDLLGFLFNALGANLRHSHVPFSFGRASHWLVSPVMHQAHHSLNSRHHNKNFGSCFACWDRWYGSFYLPQHNECFEFGCRNGGGHTLSEQYLGPFSRLIHRRNLSFNHY